MQIGVITNPHSRRNKNRPDRAAKLRSIVGNAGEVHETDSPDAIKPVLREFLRRRAQYWVADGGDGALHWMLKNGIEVLEEDEFRDGSYQLPVTVPTGGGTINFVTHNVGIQGRAEQILATLRGAVEAGTHIEEVEVDSILIEGTEKTAAGDQSFRTFGFASAVGGVGQRFYAKYYAEEDPNPRTIVKVIGNTLASMPVALSPLRHVPLLPNQLRQYARDMFEPCKARVTVDGMILEHSDYTGIHIASMSLNLGGVFRLFSKADQPGQMHCLVGATSPFTIAKNIPNMHLGREIRGKGVLDRACREMKVEATGDELLAPIIDGEYYRDIKAITYRPGPRVRIPKVVATRH